MLTVDVSSYCNVLYLETMSQMSFSGLKLVVASRNKGKITFLHAAESLRGSLPAKATGQNRVINGRTTQHYAHHSVGLPLRHS